MNKIPPQGILSHLLTTKTGKNLYNKAIAEKGYYYNSPTGTKTPYANSCVTGKIPVVPYTQYTVQLDQAGTAAFYNSNLHYWDASGNWVGKIVGSQNIVWASDLKSFTFTAVSNCYYVGATFLFNVATTTEEFNTVISAIQVEIGATLTTYEEYIVSSVLKKSYYAGEITGKYEGKKIQIVGDSITAGTYGGFAQILANITGATIVNRGSGGAATGRLVAIMTTVKDRSDTVITYTPDYTDTSAVTIQIGTNGDLIGSIEDIPYVIGQSIDALPFTVGETTITTPEEYWALFPNNHYGNIALCIEYVQYINPKCKIYLITPPHNAPFTQKLKDVRLSLLAIGRLYSVEVIDAQEKAGIDVKHLHKYSYDGTHLNANGNELWGKYIGYQLITN